MAYGLCSVWGRRAHTECSLAQGNHFTNDIGHEYRDGYLGLITQTAIVPL